MAEGRGRALKLVAALAALRFSLSTFLERAARTLAEAWLPPMRRVKGLAVRAACLTVDNAGEAKKDCAGEGAAMAAAKEDLFLAGAFFLKSLLMTPCLGDLGTVESRLATLGTPYCPPAPKELFDLGRGRAWNGL